MDNFKLMFGESKDQATNNSHLPKYIKQKDCGRYVAKITGKYVASDMDLDRLVLKLDAILKDRER